MSGDSGKTYEHTFWDVAYSFNKGFCECLLPAVKAESSNSSVTQGNIHYSL